MPRLSLTVFLLVGACAAGPDPGDGAIEGEPPDLLALDLAPRGWPCLPPPNRCPADRLCVDARCVPSPSCVDRVVNGPETDVDCGGPAGPKCPPHWGCKSNRDCANGACFGGHCDPTPLCRNGRRDRDETDVDCGGRVCLRCAEKRRCLGDDDCLGGRCANPLRAPPPCLPDLPGLPTNEGRCCDGIGRRCDERSCGGPDQCRTAAVCLTSGSTIVWPDLACGTFGRRCDSCFRKACNRHGFCANRCKTLQAMEGCDRCCDSDGRGPPGNTSASCGAVEWGCSVCGGGQVCENRACRGRANPQRDCESRCSSLESPWLETILTAATRFEAGHPLDSRGPRNGRGEVRRGGSRARGAPRRSPRGQPTPRAVCPRLRLFAGATGSGGERLSACRSPSPRRGRQGGRGRSSRSALD